MATDQDDGRDDGEDEPRPEERAAAFFNFLGLSELDYPQIAAQAVRHALQSRAWGPPPANDPQWLSIGPRNVGGRVIALAQDPEFPHIIYAGSAQGGLWRSPDAGNTWVHLGGPEHNYPVGAIAVARHDLVYIGTGEHLAAHVSGRGLFKVTPSTGNVEPLLPAGQEVPAPDQSPKQWAGGAALRYTRIVVDPDEPLRFWYGAQNGVWRVELMGTPQFIREWPANADDLPSHQDSSSSGANWPALVTDLALARHPTKDRARYLMIVAGVEGKGIYVGKFDRNDATSKIDWSGVKGPGDADGNNVGSFGRVRVALCKNQPQHLYAVFCDLTTGNNGFASSVFRSDDAGDSWTMRSRWRDGDSAQAEYDLVLECSPGNPRRIVGGDINLHLSEDGGDTWKRLLDWHRYDRGDIAQHADQHAAMFDATDRRKLWLGNDGGLSIARDLRSTSDALGAWRKMSHGISGAQFYRLGVSVSWPWMTGGGLQDNGTYLSYGGHSWMHVGGGDGGAFAFDTQDPRRCYISWTAGDPSPTDDGYVNLYRAEPSRFPANVDDAVMNDVDDSGATTDHTAHYASTRFDFATSPSVFTVAKGPFTPLAATHPDPAHGNIVFAAWRGQLLASSNGGTAFAPVTLAGGATAPTPFELVTAIAFGRLTGAGPSTAETWFGTSSGLLFHAPTTAAPPALAGPFAPAAAPPWPGGALGNMPIESIAVNRTNDDLVAIGTSPRQGPVVAIRVFTAGAPGIASFQFALGNGAFGPAAGFAPVNVDNRSYFDIPGTNFTAQFDVVATVNYVKNDSWTFLTDGDVVTVNNATAAVNTNTNAGARVKNTSTGGVWLKFLPITIAIDNNAAPYTFSYKFGVRNAAVGGKPIAQPFTLPGTQVTLSFAAGSYSRGDSWTVDPLTAEVTAQGANAQLSASRAVGGRCFFSADRGAHWWDVTRPPAGSPLTPPDQYSLPPSPVASLVYGDDGALYAGTLAGAYQAAPVGPVTALVIEVPTGGASLPLNQTLQLRATATLFAVPPQQVDVSAMATWNAVLAPAGGSVTVVGGLVKLTGVAAAATVDVSVSFAGQNAGPTRITVAAASPTAPATLPAIATAPTLQWRPFGRGLPLTLASELRFADANTLRVATFGRGMWECRVPPAAPPARLFIRQNILDNGDRAWRRNAPPLVDDPRRPALGSAGAIAIDELHAYDIRVDAAPVAVTDEAVDGVECDEQLGCDALRPAELNSIYVQVHNASPDTMHNVWVDLFWAPTPFVASPVQGPAPAPAPVVTVVPNLGTANDFYNLAASAAPTGGVWQRVAPRQTVAALTREEPAVVRFDWTPPLTLARTVAPLNVGVALVALCAADEDPLPALAAGVPLNTLIDGEQRAALRLVQVAPDPAAVVYLRDGIEDDGRGGGSVAAIGRSPDIFVTTDGTATDATFADLGDPRPADRIHAGANFVYVRVFNRGHAPATVNVAVWVVPLDASGQPELNPASWVALPAPAAFAVPGNYVDPAAPPPPTPQLPGDGFHLSPAIPWTPAYPRATDPVQAFLLVAVAGTAAPAAPAAFATQLAFRSWLLRDDGAAVRASRALRFG